MLVDTYSDLSDIFHTELFYPTSIPSDPSPSSSPAQSPFTNALLTPPQPTLPTSFPDIHLDNATHLIDTNPIDINPIDSSFFTLFDDELKATNSGGATSDPPFHHNPYDSSSASSTFFDMGFSDHMHMSSMMGMGMPMDMSLTSPLMPMEDTAGIDPQLVDSPAQSQAQTDFDADSTAVEEEEGEAEEKEKEEEEEKLVLTIPPVKVGGHGKARKGTVQSGGIVKKSAHIGAGVKDKENTGVQAKKTQVKGRGSKLPPSAPASLFAPAAVPTLALPSVVKQPAASLPSPPDQHTSQASEHGGDDDDDELPHDWRPSPEVFAKMTSKEKRQLRNKISARNFRVRRKEYISTLEGDIAERDRLLDAIRTELGSSKSENLALRQEIAALKRTLLSGRGLGDGTGDVTFTTAGGDVNVSMTGIEALNLPPPAPLPEMSAAEVLAASAAAASLSSTTTTSSPFASTSTYATPSLLTPNTQKDLPSSLFSSSSSSSSSSGTAKQGFWGGFGGGGVMPVHTALVPDVSVFATKGLENINPAMNGNVNGSRTRERERENVNPLAGKSGALGGFDGFADLNPFTMKTLDAYRMHLWGKMAAQHHHHQSQQHQHQQHQQPTQPLTGLASNLRPHFFNSSNKPNLPSTYNGYGSTLSALLSGKQASTSYPSPPPSPLLLGKDTHLQRQQQQQQQQQERDVQHAVLAAMASQTIFRKMGSAFWDAFSGSSSSSSPSLGGNGGGVPKSWDADKVRRVLEGKAVVRVVDVDQVTPPGSPSVRAVTPSSVKPSSPVLKAMASPVLKASTTSNSSTSAQKVPTSPRICAGLTQDEKKRCVNTMCDILEESMRSLTLGKKM